MVLQYPSQITKDFLEFSEELESKVQYLKHACIIGPDLLFIHGLPSWNAGLLQSQSSICCGDVSSRSLSRDGSLVDPMVLWQHLEHLDNLRLTIYCQSGTVWMAGTRLSSR